jgi:hypothetical protein
MSARRLSRLLGAALALVALAALTGGIFGALAGGVMHTNDFDWTAKFGPAVIDAPAMPDHGGGSAQ